MKSTTVIAALIGLTTAAFVPEGGKVTCMALSCRPALPPSDLPAGELARPAGSTTTRPGRGSPRRGSEADRFRDRKRRGEEAVPLETPGVPALGDEAEDDDDDLVFEVEMVDDGEEEAAAPVQRRDVDPKRGRPTVVMGGAPSDGLRLAVVTDADKALGRIEKRDPRRGGRFFSKVGSSIGGVGAGVVGDILLGQSSDGESDPSESNPSSPEKRDPGRGGRFVKKLGSSILGAGATTAGGALLNPPSDGESDPSESNPSSPEKRDPGRGGRFIKKLGSSILGAGASTAGGALLSTPSDGESDPSESNPSSPEKRDPKSKGRFGSRLAELVSSIVGTGVTTVGGSLIDPGSGTESNPSGNSSSGPQKRDPKFGGLFKSLSKLFRIGSDAAGAASSDEKRSVDHVAQRSTDATAALGRRIGEAMAESSVRSAASGGMARPGMAGFLTVGLAVAMVAGGLNVAM
ncbi:hypothetical protein C8A05DRAFT_37873 [Staphylotrichum tortipilum]|uniref:Uncharacterized protein n=1 Tax=Staphylotrichum tortipilum TaxID=2831512 RepID=A0AAN6MDM1_9PEZI|nr:hypothetical protein C8A05DRAFT_37873 [Staphylotrichum longicolle]